MRTAVSLLTANVEAWFPIFCISEQKGCRECVFDLKFSSAAAANKQFWRILDSVYNNQII